MTDSAQLNPETLALINDHLLAGDSLRLLTHCPPEHPLYALAQAILSTAAAVEETRSDFLAYAQLRAPVARWVLEQAEGAGEHTRARKDLIQMLAAYRHAVINAEWL
ncbi:hypothetical protein [Streptomyces sp. B15]|uniref:hypothetical protein n=1 Tax=Streptomyces sp. B15 TaxID=1537797 RepID=UPI001B38FBD6|nr:hypothetical protein [Streptomyces sp. B15]MBQ1123773.1 hypothetical protein [Streptomyces sp. B15]